MLVVREDGGEAPAKVCRKALHEVVPRKRLPAGPTLAQLVVIGHYYWVVSGSAGAEDSSTSIHREGVSYGPEYH